MKVLSLFSGVGGFDLGLEASGMQTVFQCESDKHCLSVLNRHWADVPKWGDISTLTGKHILAHAPQIDVVAWGSPCQDLSKAGKQEGLTGSRSVLFFEGMRIINEIRKETNGLYPKFSIWENVAGALTSNRGADFGAILDAMAEAGALVIEWALLDAQFFDIPQRRKRVFVISIFDSSAAERCGDALFLVEESLRRNPETSKETGGVTSEIDSSVAGSDQRTYRKVVDALLSRDQFRVNHEGARDGKLVLEEKTIILDPTRVDDIRVYSDVVQTLKNRMGTGGNNVPMVLPSSATRIRKLTPIECERLMGWSDDHTKYKQDGSVQADSHRYRQIGNGVATPVAKWVGEQVMKLCNTPKE